MLSKEICKRCRKEGDWNWVDSDDWNWVDSDSTIDEALHWNCRKEVFCPRIGMYISINEEIPPDGCPYLLEHAVSEEH